MSVARPGRAAPRLRITPSILNADFSALGAAVRAIEQGGGDAVHVDVMDGHFVPNLSMGPQVVRSLRSRTRLPLDVHLMVSEPARFVEPFARAGADNLTVHAESRGFGAALLDRIRRAGATPSIALKPGTRLDRVAGLLRRVRMVLLMTVEPGFGGQPFRTDVLPKMRALRARWHRDIQVDGGVTAATAADAVRAGANVLVAGIAVFGTPRPPAAIRALRRIGLAARVLAVLGLLLLGGGAARAEEFDTLVAQGKDAIALSQWKEAERLFGLALDRQPGHPEALYGAGYAAMQRGRRKLAVERFESVLKSTYTNTALKGFHTLALTRIGEIMTQDHRWDEAIKVFAQGIRNDPENPDLHAGYGVALRAKGQNEKALLQFEEALKANPKLQGALVGKASIYYELGNVPEAFHLLEQAVTQAPASALPYGVMAAFYQDMKKPYEQHLFLGHYYFYAADLNRAAGEYRTALAIKETGEAHHTYGVALLQMGKEAEAEAQFRKAVDLNMKPLDVAWAQLSHAQARQGRLKEAQDSLRKALRINDQQAAYWTQMSWISLQAGDKVEAERAARKALELDPNLAAGYRYLGDVYSAKGLARDAIDAYEKSLSRDPNQSDVYVNLGWAYEQAGDPVSAQRNYEIFLRISDDPEVSKKVRDQIRTLKRGPKRS